MKNEFVNRARPLILSAVIGLASLSGAQGLMAGPIANGSGWLGGSGPKRTFAFTAIEQADGSVSGQAQVNSPGLSVHIAIDCAVTDAVSGDLVMSGVITKSSEGGPPVGWIAFFSVRDNGNGTPDQITMAGAFPDNYLDALGEDLVEVVNEQLGYDVGEWPVNCETFAFIINYAFESSVFGPDDFLNIGGGSITEH